MDRGFPEFHVKKELYWPKGKRHRRRGARRRLTSPHVRHAPR